MIFNRHHAQTGDPGVPGPGSEVREDYYADADHYAVKAHHLSALKDWLIDSGLSPDSVWSRGCWLSQVQRGLDTGGVASRWFLNYWHQEGGRENVYRPQNYPDGWPAFRVVEVTEPSALLFRDGPILGEVQ